MNLNYTRKEAKQIVKKFKKQVGDPQEYDGGGRPGIDTVEVNQSLAWEVLEMLEMIVNSDQVNFDI